MGSVPIRRVAIVGAIAIGAVIAPAAPALAQPIDIPGVGTFDVPTLPGQPPAPFQAPQASAGQRALDAARTKVGAPYVYGAAGPNAFDCSGLVQWAYKQAGLNLPRTSSAQAGAGTPVSLDALQPGDVVSFYGGSHSGIYAGDGNVVHASTSGTPVKFASLASMPADGARRF